MTDYLTEQEQIEILKNWLKQYSFVIITGILIAVIATTSIRFWQQRQEKIYTHASAVYDEMISLRAQNDTQAASLQAQKLFRHYPKLVYGQMAALSLAKDAIAQENYTEAQHKLQWVIDKSSISGLREIARLRLARLLIAAEKPQEALTLLNTVDDLSFNGLIEETKGDAHLALNEKEKAREFYRLALKDLPHADVMRPLLQMKLDNLNV